MRFASVIHDGHPLAVTIDGDRATPLRGVTEIGHETPASLLREPPLLLVLVELVLGLTQPLGIGAHQGGGNDGAAQGSRHVAQCARVRSRYRPRRAATWETVRITSFMSDQTDQLTA